MALRRRPASGFYGVRERPSGRYAMEITADGVRWWIGTFDSAELAARAYDAAAIRFGRLKHDLNFPDTDTDYALWLSPALYFVDVTDRDQQRRDQRRARERSSGADRRAPHGDVPPRPPHLVQAELEFFAARKKKAADGAGPSAPPPPPIVVGSSSSEFSSGYWELTDDKDDAAV